MVSAGDFKKGLTIEIDGQVWVIVDFQHVKPGKGAAFVRTKLKNIMQGNVLERTFNPTEKFPKAHVETKTMEYLYNDGEIYYFMDQETYEQIPLNHSQVEDALNYVKENMPVTIKFFKGEAFSVEPPNSNRPTRCSRCAPITANVHASSPMQSAATSRCMCSAITPKCKWRTISPAFSAWRRAVTRWTTPSTKRGGRFNASRRARSIRCSSRRRRPTSAGSSTSWRAKQMCCRAARATNPIGA